MRQASVSVESVYRDLEETAQYLIQESAKWIPEDRSLLYEERRARDAAHDDLLRRVALSGGGAILRLAVQKRLESLPRIQTRAFQTRGELRRHADTGTLPRNWPPYGESLDGLIVKLFDDCCRIWLPAEYRDTCDSYGRELWKPKLYARFLTELADHLRSLPRDDRPDEERMMSDYVRDHNALRVLWEQYTRDGNPVELLRFIREHPGVTTTSGQQYPRLHRICDVILEGQAYRLLRHAHWIEYLILKPIPRGIADPDRPGVPYWLTGAQLRRWVQDELTSPTKAPTDWEQYR